MNVTLTVRFSSTKYQTFVNRFVSLINVLKISKNTLTSSKESYTKEHLSLIYIVIATDQTARILQYSKAPKEQTWMMERFLKIVNG